MPTTQHRSNDDLVREFCIQADVTSATRVKYAAHLAELSRWLKHPLSPGRVEQLSHATRADLVHFMAYLLEGDRYAGSPHARRHGSMSASTRASFIGTLNAFYGYLVAVGVIDDNPAEAMPRPKKRYRRGITLSADELRRLLDVYGTPRERIQTYLLVFTAARAGELRDLTWSDVAFGAGTIVLNAKGGTPRAVDIHPVLMTELRRWYLYLDARAEIDPAWRERRGQAFARRTR